MVKNVKDESPFWSKNGPQKSAKILIQQVLYHEN